MEERVKTSFIPKTSLATERKQVKSGGQVALVNIITSVILVIAILGAAGMFLMEQFTQANIASKRDSLERSRGAFEPATIKELSRLNTRIEAGETLLSEHVSLSKLFDELELLTLATVRFSTFSYDGANGRAILIAAGEAASFNTVALQSGGFSKSSIITDPIFSNVNIGKNGTIQFDFSAVIDGNRIRYTGAAPATTEPLPAEDLDPLP